MIPMIGVDIGQKHDPTALCAVEPCLREVEGRKETHYNVKFLERLPLGTPYPGVARRVGEVANRIYEITKTTPRIFVDATGVGAPVIDILEEESRRAKVVAVYFNHGDRRIEEERLVRLGKAYLVSLLQSLFQTRRIHLPNGTEAEVLARELLDYEIRVSEDANDRYGAFRVGTHDDLVTALGLAVQNGAISEPVIRSRSLGRIRDCYLLFDESGQYRRRRSAFSRNPWGI